MQSLPDIKALLADRGLAPNKALGQNVLVEPAHISRLVDAAGVRPGDLVLEVGPGTGALTEPLLERGATVVACELDRGLADLLRERFSPPIADGALTLVEGDCLASKHHLNPALVEALARRGDAFRLVANLPYGAASPLMIALATTFHPARTPGTPRCLGQFVTIQREVAERLRAAPGSRDYGEMGVLVQAMAQVRRLAVLPPGCFWPPPKVDSEMVSITPRAEPLTDDPASLAALCRILFTHRRKQLGGVLAKHAPALLDALPPGVTATVRAEHLTVPQLVEMAHAWKNGQRNDRREHQERR